MDENKLNGKFDDEIDLKELFLVLWRKKHIIVAIMVIGALVAGLISLFLLPPVYESNLNIVISMPKTYNTKYGEYTLPITSNDQYISLIISNDIIVNTITDMGYDANEVTPEKLLKRISIAKSDEIKYADAVQNSFNVTVQAETPQEALKLAETLFDNYIKFMDAMTKERAVKYYYDKFNVELKTIEVSLKTTKQILAKNEKLLSEVPQIIDQKGAAEAIREDGSINYAVLDKLVNENYTKVEADVITNKQSINNYEERQAVLNQFVTELEKEQKAIDKYYETGRIARLESGIEGIVDSSIYLPSPPIAPTHKTSPSNTLNVAIGLVIGAMLGVIIALIKEYWFKDENKPAK